MGRSYAYAVGPQLSQPPQALVADCFTGDTRRPSACIQAGEPSRNNGKAIATRNLRTLPGNCFFATTHALTSTASAMMRY